MGTSHSLPQRAKELSPQWLRCSQLFSGPIFVFSIVICLMFISLHLYHTLNSLFSCWVSCGAYTTQPLLFCSPSYFTCIPWQPSAQPHLLSFSSISLSHHHNSNSA
jgi:hypothetical protein